MKKTGKRVLSIVLIVVIVLGLSYVMIANWQRPQNYKYGNVMMKTSATPLFIAHGGGHFECPDNSFEACLNACTVDPTAMLEIDVSITKDGVVILSHDTQLDRKTNYVKTSDEPAYIKDVNYSDLIADRVDFGYTNDVDYEAGEDCTNENDSGHFTRKADFDVTPHHFRSKYYKDDEGKDKAITPLDVFTEAFPELTPIEMSLKFLQYGRDPFAFLATPLESLIKYFPNNIINVEIKQDGEDGMRCLDEIIRLLDEYDAFDRVVLASFHSAMYDEYVRIQKAGEDRNGIKIPEYFMYSPGTDGATKFFITKLLNVDVFFTDGLCVLQLPNHKESSKGFDLATKDLVDCAHAHNIAVHYWTVDNVDEMKQLIEIGADGIMSNLPHTLKAVYDGEL